MSLLGYVTHFQGVVKVFIYKKPKQTDVKSEQFFSKIHWGLHLYTQIHSFPRGEGIVFGYLGEASEATHKLVDM